MKFEFSRPKVAPTFNWITGLTCGRVRLVARGDHSADTVDTILERSLGVARVVGVTAAARANDVVLKTRLETRLRQQKKKCINKFTIVIVMMMMMMMMMMMIIIIIITIIIIIVVAVIVVVVIVVVIVIVVVVIVVVVVVSCCHSCCSSSCSHNSCCCCFHLPCPSTQSSVPVRPPTCLPVCWFRPNTRGSCRTVAALASGPAVSNYR